MLNAEKNSHVVLLTASGTGGMECAVLNSMHKDDKALVINGGSFGSRFCKILETLNCSFEELKIEFGEVLTIEKLNKFANKGIRNLYVNVHETSTGQLYDLKMLGDFCKKNDIRLIVDAVSSMFVDWIDMKEMNIDLIFTGSQKALALAPGLAILVVNERMYKHIMSNSVNSLYFDLKDYFKNMERGQTPFTPAVGIVLELHNRINEIYTIGMKKIVESHREKATYFRNKILDLGISLPEYPLSNGLTPLLFNGNAYDVFLEVKNNFNMMLTPNGGDLHEKVLRIGHMGNLDRKDYDELIEVLKKVL